MGRIAVEEPTALQPASRQPAGIREHHGRYCDHGCRIPTLVDSDTAGGPIRATVRRSWSISQKTAAAVPDDPLDQLEVDQWSLHGQATFGPGLTPIGHLENRIQGDNAGAKAFFRARAERLYETLNLRLQGRSYIALERYTVADVAHFTWVNRHAEQRIDLVRYPEVKRWYETILARPAVQKGIAVVGAGRSGLPSRRDWRNALRAGPAVVK
jgi:GST-like protein